MIIFFLSMHKWSGASNFYFSCSCLKHGPNDTTYINQILSWFFYLRTSQASLTSSRPARIMVNSAKFNSHDSGSNSIKKSTFLKRLLEEKCTILVTEFKLQVLRLSMPSIQKSLSVRC